VGQIVERGTPVVDLYSAELARAKTDFTIERKQWEYQKKLLETRQELAKTGAISKNLLLETENNEMRERREYEVAREKLQLFGLTNEEIDDIEQAQGPEQARLTLRSPAAGVVIRRDVVSGNIYDEGDELFTVCPADHLWVWGEVFENDLNLVSQGQKWNIEFPFLHKTIAGKVEYISQNVDPEVHAVRIRTSVPNPDGRLKADMLVRGNLEIAPEAGNVVVPRSAVVVIDGQTCAFVMVPDHADKFARRTISTIHESDDQVVIREGLAADEEVVVTGGLMLQQLYEDAAQQ
jgi:cobalt-zinc-cadmium efflux system membrane fusion protein